MILTTMIPFNIGDKVKVSEVYFLKPFCTVSDIQNADSFREVLVIDVKNNIKGNLQVLVEISDLTRRWIPIWAIRSWVQLYDKV
jgi:hypothetical protein